MQKSELRPTAHLQVVHRNKTLALHDAIADLQKLVLQLEQQIGEQAVTNKKKTIYFSTKHGGQYILLSDILYCQADGNYTRVIIRDQAPLLISKTLKAIQKELNDSRFIRCHQSYLVNQDWIIGHQSTKHMTLILAFDIQIPVSRRLIRKVKSGLWLRSSNLTTQ